MKLRYTAIYSRRGPHGERAGKNGPGFIYDWMQKPDRADGIPELDEVGASRPGRARGLWRETKDRLLRFAAPANHTATVMTIKPGLYIVAVTRNGDEIGADPDPKLIASTALTTVDKALDVIFPARKAAREAREESKRLQRRAERDLREARAAQRQAERSAANARAAAPAALPAPRKPAANVIDAPWTDNDDDDGED